MIVSERKDNIRTCRWYKFSDGVYTIHWAWTPVRSFLFRVPQHDQGNKYLQRAIPELDKFYIRNAEPDEVETFLEQNDQLVLKAVLERDYLCGELLEERVVKYEEYNVGE